MDCDSCGRYRPSPEIAPVRMPDGLLQMACGRCRRFVAGQRVLSAPRPAPNSTPIAG